MLVNQIELTITPNPPVSQPHIGNYTVFVAGTIDNVQPSDIGHYKLTIDLYGVDSRGDRPSETPANQWLYTMLWSTRSGMLPYKQVEILNNNNQYFSVENTLPAKLLDEDSGGFFRIWPVRPIDSNEPPIQVRPTPPVSILPPVPMWWQAFPDEIKAVVTLEHMDQRPLRGESPIQSIVAFAPLEPA